jgi:hypothetical protein
MFVVRFFLLSNPDFQPCCQAEPWQKLGCLKQNLEKNI